MKHSTLYNIFVGLFLAFLVAFAYVVFTGSIDTHNIRKKPFDCNIQDQVNVLTKYGEVSVYFIAGGLYSRATPTWDVRFKSNRDSGYRLETSASNESICDSMAEVYDKVMAVPLTQKKGD